MSDWRWSKAILFATAVCAFYWALSIAAAFGPQITLTFPIIDVAIGSQFVLSMLAALVPATTCFLLYAETRRSLRKWQAPWFVYLIAVATGLGLPFASYFGSHYASFPWNEESRHTLARVLAINLFLTPLWEEIIWRGSFLQKLSSFVSEPRAILVSSLAWTAWHGGYIAFLYAHGIPVGALLVLPLTYFCIGLILASLYEMANKSIWPCVLLHAALNASTTVYYKTFDRATELSSYVAELIAISAVAALSYRSRICQRRKTLLQHEAV